MEVMNSKRKEILANSMVLGSRFNYVEKYSFVNSVTPKKFARAIGCLKSFLPASKSSNFSLSKIKLTNNIYEIKELLTPDMVQGYILAGNEPVKYILFPFLSEFFKSEQIEKSEKIEKLKQLKNDYLECVRINNEEYDTDLKKIQSLGISEVNANINNVIKPYSL